MSRAGKIARRSLLIGSAAVLGGVAFGYYSYRKPVTNPLLEGLGGGEAALTPLCADRCGGDHLDHAAR